MSKPKQYIQGYVEFYKLKFKVTPDVLIPRPETELLVDEVLKYVKNIDKLTILDLGTGSGCIAISVAKNLPSKLINIKIIATEVSEKALEVARLNAKFHHVEDKIEFIQSDLLSSVPYNLSPAPLLIVTNLPYIPTARIPYLDSSVKDFEPHVALDGGEDGFELYRKLFRQIEEKSVKFNLLIGEIDYTHGDIATNEAQKYFPNSSTEVKTDLAHRQRILLINN